MKLKINKLNKYGDIQYVEHSVGNVDLVDVSPDKNWVIKNPSHATQTHFQQRVPDCLLTHFHNTPYLLSPKAVPYNTPTLYPPQTAEMMVVTTQQQGTLGFVLHKRPDKHYWQSFSSVVVPEEHLISGQAAIAACKLYLNVTVLLASVTHIGHWQLKYFFRPLIDFEQWSTTHIFHTHLPEFLVDKNNENMCFIPFQDLPHLPDVWRHAKLDGQQREVLNRVLGQPTTLRLPFIKNFQVTPLNP